MTQVTKKEFPANVRVIAGPIPVGETAEQTVVRTAKVFGVTPTVYCFKMHKTPKKNKNAQHLYTAGSFWLTY